MWGKADTHIHTTFSDGVASPAELVDFVVEKTDLQVIAVTDHDSAEGGLAAREYAQRRGYSLDVIVGQEVTTGEGDIVGLFLRSTLPTYATAREAVDAIHAQGGLAVAVHPFSFWATGTLMKGVARQIRTLPLDGVEVRNGFPTNFISNPLTGWHNRQGQQLSQLGGSDSHVPYTVGQACTLFPGRTAADLRIAIETRTTRAAGPLWLPTNIMRLVPMLLRRGLPSREQEPAYAQEPVFVHPSVHRPATHPAGDNRS